MFLIKFARISSLIFIILSSSIYAAIASTNSPDIEGFIDEFFPVEEYNTILKATEVLQLGNGFYKVTVVNANECNMEWILTCNPKLYVEN
jgi:hypothetical protein